MASFSERAGIKPTRALIQNDSLDDPTRTALWNSFLALEKALVSDAGGFSAPVLSYYEQVWGSFFERPADEFSESRFKQRMRELHLKGVWSDLFDAIEFLAATASNPAGIRYSQWVTDDFERYLVGYRLIDSQIVPVSSELEVIAIETALNSAGSNARTHLRRATEILSNRDKPQHAKVISEAISAVEATVFELTGDNTLSSGLKKLRSKGVPAHIALIDGWVKLYGYTSDSSGIRHALIRPEEVDEALAVYFLVTSSAFVNFLLKHA